MNKAFRTALSYIGLKEDTSKSKHNPEILRFFEVIGQKWVKDDETAWCAAFVNACLVMNDQEQTDKLTARSFLNYGNSTKDPQIGDIVVFWRSSRNSWKGHVGFYISEDEAHIYCLGGNQNNMVNVTPYLKSKLLGYRTFADLEESEGNFDALYNTINKQDEQIAALKEQVLNLRDANASMGIDFIKIEKLAKEIINIAE